MAIHLPIGLLLALTIGYLICHKILPTIPLSEKLAISFALGLGIVVSLLFPFILFLEILHSPNQLIVILVIICLSLYLILKPNFKHRLLLGKATIKPDACKFIIGILTLISLVISIWYPIFIIDGNDYEMTGKLISLNKNLAPENFLRNYPPFVMLSYGFVYFLGGSNPKFIFSLLYASLCIVFYWRLIDFGISKKLASTVTLILGTTPFIWWHSFLGLLNFTAGYYFACGSLFWFSYLKLNLDKSKSDFCNISFLVLAGIFYGLSIFTRSECIVYFFIPLFQVLHYHKDSKAFNQIISFFMLPVLGYSLIWGIFFASVSDNMLTSAAGISPAVYLFICVLLWFSPFLFIRPSIQNIFHLLRKKGQSNIFLICLGVALFIIPASSYLVIEIANLEPLDNFLLKSLFFFKVFTASSANLVLFHVFFGFSSIVVLFTLPLILNSFRKKTINKYLITFIIFSFFLNALIFSKAAFSRYPGLFAKPSFLHDIIFTSKIIMTYPGMLVNNTQTRSFITFFPILLFAVAYILQEKGEATQRLVRYYEKYDLFLYLTIFCNLIIIGVFFIVPRIEFMSSHWGDTRNQLLLSSGPKDNPNMVHLKRIYKALIEIEDQSKGNYPVFLLNPSFSRAEALKVLFPRKIYFGIDKIVNVKSDIKIERKKPDCYFFYYNTENTPLVNFDRELCRKFKYLRIEPSKSPLEIIGM